MNCVLTYNVEVVQFVENKPNLIMKKFETVLCFLILEGDIVVKSLSAVGLTPDENEKYVFFGTECICIKKIPNHMVENQGILIGETADHCSAKEFFIKLRKLQDRFKKDLPFIETLSAQEVKEFKNFYFPELELV